MSIRDYVFFNQFRIIFDLLLILFNLTLTNNNKNTPIETLVYKVLNMVRLEFISTFLYTLYYSTPEIFLNKSTILSIYI